MKPALVVVSLLLASPGLADSTSEHLKRGLVAANTVDYATALEEWKPLASRGNAVAQNNVGMMYQSGHGVQQDYRIAIAWYCKAADQRSAEAQYNLGKLYQDGRGVTQDLGIATVWYCTNVHVLK